MNFPTHLHDTLERLEDAFVPAGDEFNTHFEKIGSSHSVASDSLRVIYLRAKKQGIPLREVVASHGEDPNLARFSQRPPVVELLVGDTAVESSAVPFVASEAFVEPVSQVA